MILRRDFRLSLPVISEPRGFQYTGDPELARRAFEVVRALDGAKWGDRKAMLAQKRLLAQAVLRRVPHRSRRPNRRVLGGGVRGGGADVFELERHHAHAPREVADRLQVIVRRGHLAIGNLSRRRVDIGRERVHAVPHPPGGDREHPPELPGPEHADRRPGKDWFARVTHCCSAKDVAQRRSARPRIPSDTRWPRKFCSTSGWPGPCKGNRTS